MRAKHKDPILFRAQVLAVQSFGALAGAAMLPTTVILAWPSQHAAAAHRASAAPIGEISLGRLCDRDHNPWFIFGHKS